MVLTTRDIMTIAIDFQGSIKDALAGRPSPLKALPSYLDIPSGNEQGKVLALDFGGTNARALQLTLRDGKVVMDRFVTAKLRDDETAFNIIGVDTDAEELFDFLAGLIWTVSDGMPGSVPLGHTFSFPCRQQGVNEAFLMHWTKEIKVGGVEGKDINQLLAQALKRQGLPVRPTVILNDTVATLITAVYESLDTDIGSICGTGHNTCYREPAGINGSRPMIINLESGNFNRLSIDEYDTLIDEGSDQPGEQILEKMVSGRYLGERVRLMCLDDRQTARGVIAQFAAPDSMLLEDAVRLGQSGRIPAEIVKDVIVRSAQLAAACYLGIIQHLDPRLVNQHGVGIDGSLYAKIPLYSQTIQNTLQAAVGRAACNINVRAVQDGSGKGAGIAALKKIK